MARPSHALLLCWALLLLLPLLASAGQTFGKEWHEFDGVLPSATRGQNRLRHPERPAGLRSLPPIPPKDEDLTLLISVTSGAGGGHLRQAIRQTWALPCVMSPACDLRFFVDIMNISSSYAEIKKENDTYGDVVIRGQWCAFMETRHTFEKLNFGNTFKKPWVYGGGGVPYYQFRGLYKLDWKICHATWARVFNKLARYHLWAEDDSFVCTENLLHQLQLLREANVTGRASNWRAGDPKWDGYDDNLTLMTKDITEAFGAHYPEPGFNCSRHADDGDPAPKAFLSWGNSWMSRHCGWRGALEERFNISMIVPWLWTRLFSCPALAPLPLVVNVTARPSAVPTPAPTSPPGSNFTKIELFCPATGPTVHNKDAGRFMHYEKYIEHACEYMFVIHKVAAHDMDFLWDNATAHNYHNLSAAFLMDGTGGWHEILHRVEFREAHCHDAANVTECLQWRRRRLGAGLDAAAATAAAAEAERRSIVMKQNIDLYYPHVL